MTAQRGQLQHGPSDYIDGAFRSIAGDAIMVRDPSDGCMVVWSSASHVAHVGEAVAAARAALPAWSARPLTERVEILQRYAAATTKHVDRIADRITLEMGKVRSESLLEAKLLAEKLAITLDDISMGRVRGYDVPVNTSRTASWP